MSLKPTYKQNYELAVGQYDLYVLFIEQAYRLMNKKQKMQVALIIIAAILIVIWFVLPGSIETRILGVISNALLILSMVLSYRAEEKNKKKTE